MGAESKNRITELMIACSRGELARAEELLASGADVNARDRFGYSALMYAAGGGHSAVVEMLLSSGADVGAKNRNGLTGLDLAAARGHSTIAGLLRNARFFHAARDGDVGLLSELLDAGADVNAQHTDGWTALMTAALYDRPEVVAVLLRLGPAAEEDGDDFGAEAGLHNDAGWTALLIAERKGHARVAAALRQAKAESPWGDLPPTEMPAELPDDSEDLKPLIEMPDHPDA